MASAPVESCRRSASRDGASRKWVASRDRRARATGRCSPHLCCKEYVASVVSPAVTAHRHYSLNGVFNRKSTVDHSDVPSAIPATPPDQELAFGPPSATPPPPAVDAIAP